jgi:hypothetical protein
MLAFIKPYSITLQAPLNPDIIKDAEFHFRFAFRTIHLIFPNSGKNP